MQQEDCSTFSDLPSKTPVPEPSVTSWDSEGVGISRTKMATSGVNDKLAEVHEVRRRFAAQRLEDDGGQFEDDSLLHWQPVQARQNW